MRRAQLVLGILFLALLPLGAEGRREAAAGGISGFKQTGFPIVTDPVTFNVVTLITKARAGQPYKKELGVFKELGDKTNVRLSWQVLPIDNSAAKLSLMFASGDYPDAFYNVLPFPDAVRYGGDGIVLALNGLIDSYMPELRRVFQDRPDAKKMVTGLDGKIYAFPRINELNVLNNAMQFSLFTNTEWLKRVGLELPKTTADFEKALRAFRDKDANGNGKPSDEIPFSFIWRAWSNDMSPLWGPFGITDDSSHIAIQNGKVFLTAVQPEFKEAVRWLSKLYSEKLIDPEGFTQKSTALAAKIQGDLVGTFYAWSPNIFADNRAEISSRLAYTPALSGPDGKRMMPRTSFNGVLTNAFNITDKCKVPQVLARYVDFCYTQDQSIQLEYGPFGYNLTKAPDGRIKYLPPTIPGMDGDTFFHQETVRGGPSAILRPGYGDLVDFPEDMSVKMRYNLENYVPYAPKEFFPTWLIWDKADQAENAVLATDIRTYVEQKIVQWITGQANVDRDWDDFAAQLSKMKVDRYLQLYQKYYDVYLKM